MKQQLSEVHPNMDWHVEEASCIVFRGTTINVCVCICKFVVEPNSFHSLESRSLFSDGLAPNPNPMWSCHRKKRNSKKDHIAKSTVH